MLRSLVFIWSQMTFIWREPTGIEQQYNYLQNLTEQLEQYDMKKVKVM